ncbi:NAD-dependent protein deacetylase Sirt2 [Lucilia sericata]|uniref:NAD-dependent protein deacetylase Sirt2 n=1 Tax=Lucilia sericata TaxID=13632 RepID=UPI0018A82328|nr:NAD-dependent protein deacetylase Sirt2 [Lucilia sericata]
MSEEKPTSSKNENKESLSEREKEETDDNTMEAIRKFFSQKLNLVTTLDEEDGSSKKVIENLTFEGLCDHWKSKGFKNIITMVGAGISTSAGIPDFRSPGSGLYDNLQKYNLPHPSAIFEMDYFEENPQPFFALAKELYPGSFNPTPSHYFVRLLHDKGLLLRHYTQNIDTLERIAGLPDDKLVEAHGTFFTNHCLGCRKLYSMEWMKEQIFADSVPTCTVCNCVVKPDIVFFGENLPEKFYTLPAKDFNKCDLLIIMGTSLEVQPFASLIDRANSKCVRLLINRTKVGNDFGGISSWFMSGPGLMFDNPKNTRDIAYIGDCDDGCLALADALGWKDELQELIKSEHERLDKENPKDKGNTAKNANSDKEEDEDKINDEARKVDS